MRRLAARSHHLNHDPLKHCSENDSCVNMEVRARLHASLQPCRGHLEAACRAGRPAQPARKQRATGGIGRGRVPRGVALGLHGSMSASGRVRGCCLDLSPPARFAKKLAVAHGARGDLVDTKGMNVLASAAAIGQVGVINAVGEKLGVGENMPQTALEQADAKGH